MTEHFTNMRALSRTLADTLNMIDPSIENHHQQTAYLAYMIARAAKLDETEVRLTHYAALLHDIGFITTEHPQNVAEAEKNAKQLARIGANMMEGFPRSAEVANIVRHCQSAWSDYLAFADEERETYRRSARMASVVHLADAVSTMIRADVPILNQMEPIRRAVSALRGTEFSEDAVDAFLDVSALEFIWMDLRYNPQFLDYFTGEIETVSLDRTVELTAVISHVVDYRSPFTAMHSAGVAASAVALAGYAGMSEDECKMMQIAGHLHDIGKLKVPRAILEKPGKLTEEEFNVIKEHPYYTRLNTMNVEGFEQISRWAAFHHEKLNGRGYPFHLDAAALDTGSRIMAVADIFSAITEVRPYRKGMEREQALGVLRENVRSGGIDAELVALLAERYEEIDRLREAAARREGNRYYASIAAV